MAMVSWNSAINSEVFSSFFFFLSYIFFLNLPVLNFYSLSFEIRDRPSKFSAERKRETETTTTPTKSSKLRLRPRALAFVASPPYAPFSTFFLFSFSTLVYNYLFLFVVRLDSFTYCIIKVALLIALEMVN
jgi:hypothetical protein